MAVTFQASYVSAFTTTTTPKTVAVTVNAGDLLLVWALTQNSATEVATPSGGSLTYVPVQALGPSSGYGCAYAWVAACPSTQSFDVSASATGGGRWGIGGFRVSGCPGVGISGTNRLTSAAGYVHLFPTSSNCFIFYTQVDALGVSGTSRTWMQGAFYTPTSGNGLERLYERSAGNITVYAAYWPSESTAGANYGLTAPTGQTLSAIAVELASVITHQASAAMSASGSLTASAVREAMVSAAMSASGTLTANAVREIDASATLSAEAAMTATATHIIRPWDLGWNGEVLFETVAVRDRWARRITDWVQAYYGSEDYDDPGGVYTAGVTSLELEDQAAIPRPALRWSFRVADELVLAAQQLGQEACDDPDTIEGGQGTHQIDDGQT